MNRLRIKKLCRDMDKPPPPPSGACVSRSPVQWASLCRSPLGAPLPVPVPSDVVAIASPTPPHNESSARGAAVATCAHVGQQVRS